MIHFFENTYVITCHSFVDRQKYIKQHFSHHGVKFQFYSAVETQLSPTINLSQSETSLVMAHLHCIINAKLNNYSHVVICEDDVALCSNFIEQFTNFFSGVPNDWDFLQLGNQYWATRWLTREYIHPNLYRFKWGTGSHCIIIRNTVYEDAINLLSQFTEPVDLLYYNLFSNHNCYCPEKFLADALSKNDHLHHYDSKYLFDSTIKHKNV